MINKSMDNKKSGVQPKEQPQRKPNELAGVQLSTHVKIFDPNTKEVFVQKRGDI